MTEGVLTLLIVAAVLAAIGASEWLFDCYRPETGDKARAAVAFGAAWLVAAIGLWLAR